MDRARLGPLISLSAIAANRDAQRGTTTTDGPRNLTSSSRDLCKFMHEATVAAAIPSAPIPALHSYGNRRGRRCDAAWPAFVCTNSRVRG